MKAIEASEELWKQCAIDAYVPVPDPGNWLPCPKCHVIPRIWTFDNGRYAKCCCVIGTYTPATVEAESIGDYYRKHKTVAGYDPDLLRKNWNKHVESIS